MDTDPHAAKPQKTQPTDSSSAFFKTLPKSFQVALIVGIGLLLAAIVAIVALLLSGGDSQKLDSTNKAADDGSAAAGSTQTQAPQTPASNASGNGGENAPADNDGTAGSGGTSSSSAGSPASAVNTNPSANSTITINADGFSPADMTIAKNTAITWKNADSVDHAIDKADDKPGPHSPQLKSGATYSYTYTSAGTYRYIDVMRPDKGGTITVKD